VVIYNDLGEHAGFHGEGLFGSKRHYIWRFWVHFILTWCQRNLEATRSIGLDLSDLFSVHAVNCQSGLIRLIGTRLSLLHDRAIWTDEGLPLHTAVGRGGFDR